MIRIGDSIRIIGTHPHLAIGTEAIVYDIYTSYICVKIRGSNVIFYLSLREEGQAWINISSNPIVDDVRSAIKEILGSYEPPSV
jgi:hypothetical protein